MSEVSVLLNQSFVAKVKSFLSNKRILVLDQSGSVRSQLTKLLADLGANRNYIFSVRNTEEAKTIMNTEKVSVILSEFEIDGHACLPLFNEIISKYTETERALVLVTKNSQQSSVAQAMEGEVDAYIIKPFVYNFIRESLFKTILSKVSPSSDHKKLQEAHRQIMKRSYYLAEPLLVELIKKQKKPTMALYLYGKLFLERGDKEKAVAFYKKALRVQKGHFKSLNALYELYKEENKTLEALETLEEIRSMLPLSPKRLENLFELYCDTKQFMKIFDLLPEYRDLDSKSEDLVRTVIDSLVLAGQSFANEERLDLSHECFYTALGFGGFELDLLSEICDFLVETENVKLAEFMLSKSKVEDRSTKEFMVLDFKVNKLEGGEAYILSRGRELMKLGFADVGVYFDYIKTNIAKQKKMPAEQALSAAKKDYPDFMEFWSELGTAIELGILNDLLKIPILKKEKIKLDKATASSHGLGLVAA